MIRTITRAGERLVFGAVLLATTGCATLAPASGPRPGTLPYRLDSIFSDTSIAHSHIGVEVRMAESGRTLYERNSERMFVPASNMKLITGAAALVGLGPDYAYRTRVAAQGPIRDGVLEGSLVVFGTGDPTLSERFHDDPRDVFRAWADSLRTHGIHTISGSVIGVDSAFPGPSLGAGWSWDDLDSYYAAEYGALQFNEGAIRVDVHPGAAPGAPAVVVLRPGTQYIPVYNRATTTQPGGSTESSITREERGPGFIVTGEIAADTSVGRDVAVRDPARFTLTVLREALRDAGITVDGPAITFDELEPGNTTVGRALTLFTHTSPPLTEILPGMMKPSQNWIAETLLLTLGRELGEAGTARAGAAVVDSAFAAWGLETDELRVRDGSGMSRYNLVSPDFIADLLALMARGPYADLWVSSLPVGGEDGTLARRMPGPPLFQNVQAKTGTLSGVRSLSGYLTTASGDRVIFSTMVNNHARSAAAVDRVVDAALEALATGM